MSLLFQILGSSSSGNCSLIQTPQTQVLIDAGFTGKRINSMLKDISNTSIDNIDAVFLTHEHSDHSIGLRGLSSYPHLSFFANKDTASALQPKLSKPLNWRLFQTGDTWLFKDLEISSFPIPHDAYDPVGYIFRHNIPGGSSIAWVTDLGYIPTLVSEKVRHVSTLVIESNYDKLLLESDTKRPFSIKQRIMGRHGHLSNDDTFHFLSNTQNTSWQKIFLAHLSKDCNSPDIVKEKFLPLTLNQDQFSIHIVDPNELLVLST